MINRFIIYGSLNCLNTLIKIYVTHKYQRIRLGLAFIWTDIISYNNELNDYIIRVSLEGLHTSFPLEAKV